MQTLRYIFVVFVLGAFSSSSIFADEKNQEAAPLDISYQIPTFTHKETSSFLPGEAQKTASVSEVETSSVPEEAQKPTPLKKIETASNLSKEVQSPKLNASSKTPSLTEVKAASTPPVKQGNGRSYMHFPSTKSLLSSNSVFFQTNIGAGFLYFSGVRGNLMGRPVSFFVPASQWRDIPLKGRLKYNRTPLFEYLLGCRLNSWAKVALSYQYQGGLTVQSKVLQAYIPGGTPPATNVANFTSNLSLNAFLLKFYFEMPYAAVFKNLAISPYLAVGIGPGWQSWTLMEVNYRRGNAFFVAGPLPLSQKISANAVWMLDAGFRLQSHSKDPAFSVLLGCKYNQWGQARSMGKMSQQSGDQKLALTQPLRIKTLYQFAPYLGFQWNFMNSYTSKSSYCLNGKHPNVRLPYFARTSSFQSSKVLWTQFNVGLGLLYFSGVKGNLMGLPVLNFSPANQTRDVPLKGELSYNRTPLFEYLLGYRFNSWAKMALSYQYQSGVVVQTKALWAYPVTNPGGSSARFISNLSLNAILFKLYFTLPHAMIVKSLSIAPHLAVGVGPGWQSWTGINVNYVTGADINGDLGYALSGGPLKLHQKISANAVWMLDAGFRIQSAYPNGQFSALLGCKYNQWGQARNMGKMSQQPSHKLALTKPFRIKTVYQFAPYLGVQWNFSNSYTPKSSYCLKGKSPNVWIPYWARTKSFQCSKGYWSQFNVGLGLLYFSGIRGNLMGQPVLNFLPQSAGRDAPYKGRLSYNPTPLFEYLIGYQFNSWLKLALSYQHQGGVIIQSKALQAFPVAASNKTTVNQFLSNLNLDALLAKVYFELPFSMIWKQLSTTPYLAVGVGPGWQSWTRIQISHFDRNTNFINHVNSLRDKISANAVWMVDAGFRIQTAYPKSSFAVLLGCKYNQWGQARSMGKMSQSGAYKMALGKPMIIKTVYQFAPYFGVQWNF